MSNNIPDSDAYLRRVVCTDPFGFTVDVFQTPSGGLKAYAGQNDNRRFGDGEVVAHKAIPGQPHKGYKTVQEAQEFVNGWPRDALAFLARNATTRLSNNRHVDFLQIPGAD